MSKGVQLAIGMLTVFGGVALLITVAGPGEGTFQYYKSVSAFVENGRQNATTAGRNLRVHGFVLEGSIIKDLPAGHVDFVIRDRGTTQDHLEVRLIGLDIPDLFKDGAEVVVEGRFENGRFLADRVMAKCPSKYEAEAGAEA
jgi:cytochrome c-type biogenesis protein CcmE